MTKLLYLITGPTASGKTDLSIEMATRLGSPVISCDSRQIFKELRIGTAPPSREQLQAVDHYFIHSHSIFDNYTAGRYETEALPLIEKLFAVHDELVMVGGSGLYADAVVHGIDDFPPADNEIREGLALRLKNEGLESLRRDLKLLDPQSYCDVDISNPQRVIRALEVTLATGKKFSSYKSYSKKVRNFVVKRINLDPDRDELYKRINTRVERMVEQGLIEEASSVYPYRNLTSLKTVGYRELFDYFDGKVSLDEAVDLIKRNTRRYAKRQVTWFKRYENQ